MPTKALHLASKDYWLLPLCQLMDAGTPPCSVNAKGF